jgi:hypothetical protein
MSGNGFVYLMIGLQALAVVGYANEGEWYKCLYFVGAVILSIGVLGMK